MKRSGKRNGVRNDMEYRCKSSGKCSRGKACCYSCRYKRDCSEMVPCFSDPKICGHAVEKIERQRIEWMQMFPDDGILDDYERQAFRCCNCKFYNACEDEKKSSNAGHIAWWHEVATLEQFRKDVGLDEK